MRKRLALLFTLVVTALALALPATTAAATPGSFKVTSESCGRNNTVHATFKITKYAGYYGTKMVILAKGQVYKSTGWKTISTSKYTAWINSGYGSYAAYTASRSFTFKSAWGAAGYGQRIQATGTIWNGGRAIGKATVNSGYCY
jgi:hypothetical protein